MAARPLVSVFSAEDPTKVASTVPLAGVLTAPIRLDVVQSVHTGVAKNARQAYAVKKIAGEQTSAISWGTGRAVARIPRVSGGGTHRSGQAAFGNMCRGGRMFAPTKVWRKWHRKISVSQRRYALVSALAATALPALVMARGHRIEQVPELPLVMSAEMESMHKTKNALALLTAVGANEDVSKAKNSRAIRRGKGKMRNRRHVMRRGPLIIYNEDNGLVKAFRNLPGVELCQVSRLNLLQLAPGGHMGRFCVWTKSAFEELENLYGKNSQKKGFVMPRNLISTSDIARVINSDEIQSIVTPALEKTKYTMRKRNPLKNVALRIRLNPYAKVVRDAEILAAKTRAEKKAKNMAAKRKSVDKAVAKKRHAAGQAFYKAMLEN